MSYQFAYLIGTICLLFPVWLLIYFIRRDLRAELLLSSCSIAVVGVLSEFWFTKDYWNPETFFGLRYGVEDLIFGFLIGGIVATAYEVIFRKRILKRSIRLNWGRLLTIVIIFLLILVVLNNYLGVNSIYSSMVGFIGVLIYLLFCRSDLLINALWSGVFFSLLMFFAYLSFLCFFPEAISRWWQMGNISGVMVRGIPVEELVWAFCWGLIGGPMYEFIYNAKLGGRR